MSSNPMLPNYSFNLTSSTVTAKPRKLKAKWSIYPSAIKPSIDLCEILKHFIEDNFGFIAHVCDKHSYLEICFDFKESIFIYGDDIPYLFKISSDDCINIFYTETHNATIFNLNEKDCFDKLFILISHHIMKIFLDKTICE